MPQIEDMIKDLPPDLRQEVEDFVQFLLHTRVKRVGRKPNLNWRGALRGERDNYTSVELQHRLRDAWGD
ncbi:MAG: DUF2281 domain-containing protein [Candidatus Hydrogenedentes bacterium]|nr:DUF2281 domain-containing protein [Candidatus Hydrogenedentota bacterium]